jgi:hypothetical protein
MPDTDFTTMPSIRIGEEDESRTESRNLVLGGAVQWGLASVLLGCTVLVGSLVLLVFNILLFRGGAQGIPVPLAIAAGFIGVLGVVSLGVASVIFGIRGWYQAYAERSSAALGIAGVAVSIAGLMAFLIAGIDLILILLSFPR